jgi:hypothetical protein
MQCQNPIWIKNERGLLKKGTEVPCGKCLSCLEQRRSVWTYRILQELEVAETARFVTLTYDEKYLPWINEKGYITENLWLEENNTLLNSSRELKETLSKDHLRNFLKKTRNWILKEQISNLRSSNKDLLEEADRYLKKGKKLQKWETKAGLKVKWVDTWNPKLRYFACGEYGSKGNRPHYHVILFNVPLRWYKWDPIHQEWFSNKLEDIWEKGFVHVGDVNRQSAHYTAKYTIKNLMDEWDENDIRVKPFATMSKKPGIGINYTNNVENRNYHIGSETSHTRIQGGYIQPIGRYYKDKIWPKETPNKDTPWLQVWPKSRYNATQKAVAYGKKQENSQFDTEIRKEDGDILQAEENVRELRREQFEIARKKAKHSLLNRNKL